MPKRSAPSAHDVARLAGVSQAAVSRAFTPGASIAEETKERVLRAATSIGYRPNLIARSLIKGESGLIGVIIGHLNPLNPPFVLSLNALSERLSRAGKHILTFTSAGDAADVHVEDLLKFRVDALVLMGAGLSSALAEQCRKEGIPVVFFNRLHPRMRGFSVVSGDDRAGGEEIAQHLLQQGYRKLAVIAGLQDSVTGREREAGFIEHLVARGFPTPMRAVGHFRRDGAIHAARELLSRPNRPDAVFCANDFMALAMLEVARYEFGLEIGRQIGIAGFDDIEQASWPSFDLTTYSLPVDAMIEEVSKILLANPISKRPVHRIINGVLKPRGSTRRELG